MKRGHARIADLTAIEEARLRTSFPQRVKAGSQAVNAAVGSAAADLEDLDRASVEYAIAVASMFADGDLLQRGWARLMPLLAEIRPTIRQGMRSEPKPPIYFGDLWPHQRLGHPTWHEFVKADRRTVFADDGRTPIRGPGLGWSPKYEADLFRGWQRLCKIVGTAMPDATHEQLAARIEAKAEQLGPDTVMHNLGRNSIANYTFSDASAAQAALARMQRKPPALGIPKGITVEELAAHLRRRFKDEPDNLAKLARLLQEETP